MIEQPEWTPEQQEIINHFARLDTFTAAIVGYMMAATELPLNAILKLLPLAEIAWREKDPKGALVFFDIDSASPRVRYSDNPIVIALHKLGPNRCVVPLEAIFVLVTNRAKGVQ